MQISTGFTEYFKIDLQLDILYISVILCRMTVNHTTWFNFFNIDLLKPGVFSEYPNYYPVQNNIHYYEACTQL